MALTISNNFKVVTRIVTLGIAHLLACSPFPLLLDKPRTTVTRAQSWDLRAKDRSSEGTSKMHVDLNDAGVPQQQAGRLVPTLRQRGQQRAAART